jgi:hypothetical protein
MITTSKANTNTVIPFLKNTKSLVVKKLKKANKNNLSGNWDICIIGDGEVPNKFPMYPIYGRKNKMDEKEPKDYVIFTKAMLGQMNLTDFSPAGIAEAGLLYLGGVITDLKIKANLGVSKSVISRMFPKDFRYFKPNNHGWLSSNTKYSLRYILQLIKKSHKNICVVELGSWLGQSTIEILKNLKGDTLYCFDKFQNILLSDYDFSTSSPLDKFWYEVPRFETFGRNISPFIKNNKVYAVKHDVNYFFDFVKKPDFVFIDAIKSEHKLYKMLKHIFSNTNAIVVGDDYVFQSVRNASSKVASELGLWFYNNTDCYIMSKKDFGDPKKFIEKSKQKYERFYERLLKKQFSNILDGIDINHIMEFYNNNTCFTAIVIEVYSKGEKEAIPLMEEAKKMNPKAVPNSLFLTYRDYIENKIVF